MAITLQVITSLARDGSDLLGTKNIAVRVADESIVSGSLLTVESTQFCILKSRGAVLNVFETGQYPLQTPDAPLLGSLVKGFFGGSSPWVYEVIYVNRSKLAIVCSGYSMSAEMAEISWFANGYISIRSSEAALALTTHLPFNGHAIDKEEISVYTQSIVAQALAPILQVMRLEDINKNALDIREAVKPQLASFLGVFGITVDELTLRIRPTDDRTREILSLKALGLSSLDAVRYHLALRMADKGVVSAPNAAVGLPFSVGYTPGGPSAAFAPGIEGSTHDGA